MGGKSSAPAPPDYTPIAQADAQQAQLNFQLGQQQLDWAKNQFNTVWPFASDYLKQQTATSAAQTQEASALENNFNNNTLPIEKQFSQQAGAYANPANASQLQGEAEGDVANAANANRASALSSLESYGIDPSQTRFGALDLSTRVGQAAATAAAGTQSRLNTQATGLSLEGEAVNMGEGLQNNVAQAYATATNAGRSGIDTANSTTQTGSNTQGSPLGFGALSASNLAGQTSALNASYQNQLAGAQFDAQQSAGFGQLIGGALGAVGSIFL